MATHILLLQVFSRSGNSVQQPHSQGDIFILNPLRVISYIYQFIGKLSRAVNLKVYPENVHSNGCIDNSTCHTHPSYSECKL